MSAADRPRAIVIAVEGDSEMVVGRVVAARLDLAIVHGLARLRLVGRRFGYDIRLRDVCPQLCELLELVGLADLLIEGRAGGRPGPGVGPALAAALGLEVGREPEGGEEPGVEVDEVVDPGDPAV